MSEVVLVEVADHVATVTLNRPDKLNAMSTEVFEALLDAGRRVADDQDVRAVLLKGSGRAFSSGLDLASFAGGGLASGNGASDDGPRVTAAAFEARIPRTQESFNVWARMPKPVVAAVHGYALGAGLQLAIAADIRIAADDCTWSVFEITYGLVPDLGATQRLPRLCGAGRAKELIWTARRFTSAEAERWGIVNKVVAADALEKEATEFVKDLASRPPIPIRLSKELVDASSTTPVEEGVRREGIAQALCIFSNDAREAVQAAFTKQPGSYTNS